jgi:sugar lactone lactonase YvrE
LGLAAVRVSASAPQAPQAPVSPNPTERDWSGQNPVRYPDPDIIALDNRFRRYIVGNTPIRRLHTGTLWAEGPAWNGVGRYLVWSDAPNNVQMRYIEDDARVTVFRNPSGNSNGNTFDYEGRQLSCEHGNRRVVRYEQNGSVTVIAAAFQGKRLNSPNDIVVHPDGSIWFTDPIYGIRAWYEGNKADSEIKPGVYRFDTKSGQLALITDEMSGPNGLCFSPDHKILYVADTGTGREIRAYDVDGGRVATAVDMRSSPSRIARGFRRRRWHALRHGRQSMGGGAAGCADHRARRRRDWNDSAARELRQRLLRRREAESAVHDGSQSLYAVYVEAQGAGIA